MKSLNKLLKIGILSLSIPLFTSYNLANKKRIPFSSKLEEIENSAKIKGIDCAHKNWRYYMNLKAMGEDVYLVTGWLNELKVLHMYIRDSKGRVLDAAIKTNNDGEINQKEIGYRDIWTFDEKTTIKQSLERKKYYSRDLGVIKDFLSEHKKNYTKRKKAPIDKSKSIENYCKQDALAWEYYKKHIDNN